MLGSTAVVGSLGFGFEFRFGFGFEWVALVVGGG